MGYRMAQRLAALIAGLLFGAGLTVSRMIDPATILAFLDFAAIADGGWNPSLALVMAGALAVTVVGYRVAFARGRPLFSSAFSLPAARAIDRRLVGGAALFGLGWGLVGYCPGPALAGLGQGSGKTVAFVIAMLAGMTVFQCMIAARAGHADRSGRPPAR
jgi:hypothetical protein